MVDENKFAPLDSIDDSELSSPDADQDELFEHLKIVVDKNQGPLRIDKFLNNRVQNIDENINELKRGIENLKNYHKQQENKLKEKKEKQNQDLDVLEKEINITNEVFIGAPGIVNDMGIRKPSYYAYYLLNKLGNRRTNQWLDFFAQ